MRFADLSVGRAPLFASTASGATSLGVPPSSTIRPWLPSSEWVSSISVQQFTSASTT